MGRRVYFIAFSKNLILFSASKPILFIFLWYYFQSLVLYGPFPAEGAAEMASGNLGVLTDVKSFCVDAFLKWGRR
jgi:hypothetical protein